MERLSIPLINNNNNNLTTTTQEVTLDNGHEFKRKTFHKPTFCHHCSEMLWGLKNQGMQCTTCAFVTHERCKPVVVTPCTIKGSTPIQIPHAHTLVLHESSKKRFCNVCRQRLDTTPKMFRCQVCPYYVHGTCRRNIVHNCKISSTFTSSIPKHSLHQKHHWTEGHLPLRSICRMCGKVCASTECLTGLRCSWCLKTIHSSCVTNFTSYCDFGVLSKLVLPPYSVRTAKKNIWDGQDRWNQQPTLINGNDEINSDELVLRVYEGSVEDPNGWRNISYTKESIVADILADTLRSYRIRDERSKYYLVHFNQHDGEETAIPMAITFYKHYHDSKSQIFLRHSKLDEKEADISIYSGNINTQHACVTVKLNIMALMKDALPGILESFNIHDSDLTNYSIMQMKLAPDRVTESYISLNDSLYSSLVDRKKQSMRELHTTRFYLQPKEEPVTDLVLFFSRLPTELSKQAYAQLFQQNIENWDDDGIQLDAVFPYSGCVALRIKDKSVFNKISPSLRKFKNTYECSLCILPQIMEQTFLRDSSPVLVLINSKSGGGQGAKLMTTFKRLLNPNQVVDLLDRGPLVGLYMFRRVENFRVLICGGDGTFGWVLSCLDEISRDLKCEQPNVALLPLGTGNDLSRVLNWGAGYAGESPLSILENIDRAETLFMDRWTVMFDRPLQDSDSGDDPVHVVKLNNYFSVGIDAELCLDFHFSREENPEKFTSRLHNKGVYFKAGLRKLSKNTMSDLRNKIQLEVDGKEIELPNMEGLAVLNIASWGAGADPWGRDKDESFQPPSLSDGLVEIVAFTGVYHMGKIKSGLSTGIRVAQGTQINLQFKEPLPIQIDGEPWVQPKCGVQIRPMLHQVAMLTLRKDDS